jgi:hypothetical protein
MLDPECLAILNRFEKAMQERVAAENAFIASHPDAMARGERLAEAKADWSRAIDEFIAHRRTCPDCPRSIGMA